MIEWLLQFFETKLSHFELEYGTALVSNLCLNTVAQSTVLRYKDHLLAWLANMLKHNNVQVSLGALGASSL